MIKIYIADNSERAEIESAERGCRLDVLVEIDNRYYQPVINTLERLSQEANEAFYYNEIFHIDPCQVIVKKIDNQAIIEAIVQLSNNHFFDYFVPVNLNTLYKNSFVQLTDIANWTCIYQSMG